MKNDTENNISSDLEKLREITDRLSKTSDKKSKTYIDDIISAANKVDDIDAKIKNASEKNFLS